jgi:hypothetical protein
LNEKRPIDQRSNEGPTEAGAYPLRSNTPKIRRSSENSEIVTG